MIKIKTKTRDLKIIKHRLTPFSLTEIKNNLNNADIKDLLNDIKKYRKNEIETNNKYAFNVKETNGTCYNIVLESNLDFTFSHVETSLESITNVINSIISLHNGHNFKLNKLSDNEILNIEFLYEFNSSKGEKKVYTICIILRTNPDHSAFCVSIYKDCNIGYRLLGKSFSLGSFETAERFERELDIVCIEDEKG